MSLLIEGSFDRQCTKCGKKYSFQSNEIEFEEIERQVRSDGNEIHYQWCFETICNCENNIKIEYDIWEYPLNTLSGEPDIILEGMVNCNFRISFDDSFS